MLPPRVRSEVLGLLRCPECAHSPLRAEAFSEDAHGIDRGVVWCAACGSWFPIEGGVLELLRGSLAYADDRARFWKTHEPRLRAHGLKPARPQTAAAHDASVREQQAHFDWYAHNDEQTYETYEGMPFWKAADALAFGRWTREVAPGRRLLDVACAQGRSTFPWMDLDLDIVAFDVSRDLIRQAVARYREARPRARATFLVANAVDFPFASNAFDYVLAYGVLHHMPDPAQTCREIGRVVRPGGAFFGSENNRTVFRGAFDALQALRTLWHEEAGTHALISQRDLRAWLEPLGFRTSFRTSVFVPPHAVNWFDPKGARGLLRRTDRIGQSIPLLRRQGGLILLEARKLAAGASAAVTAREETAAASASGNGSASASGSGSGSGSRAGERTA
jgi:ubiquinone/menaquinone biosynthesis C-methylase UbiE/uncharacterized protein YbaR (Trm112 family)